MLKGLMRKLATYRPAGLEPIDRQRLAGLRGSRRGRRVFVIGNGPSLNRIDLTALRDEITIGSNGIFLIADKLGFLPTYYTVEDTLVAEDRAGIINGLRGTTKIFPRDLEFCLKRDPDTIYVNFLRPGYAGFPRFSDRFEDRVFWGGTVTFMNLQLAYFLGCRPIYLIGVDHHYQPHTAADDKQGSVITSGSDDVNHFHPDYFGRGFRYHDPRVDRMEQAYRVAREFLSRRDCEVFNATAGGKLEVFPRVALGDVVRGASVATDG